LAELCYREAVRHAPRLAPALSNLAAALRPQRKLAEAENLCREALTLAPDYAEAYSNLAAVLIDCGQLDEAERYGREALRLKPDLPQAHVNAALLLMRRRRYAEAEAACRRALELKPDYAIAHNSLGWVLNETGRFQESADALHQALRLAPDMIDACCNLGCLHAEQLAYAEAFRWYEEALRRDSSCVTAHFGLALLYLAQGDFEKGWAEYEWRWRRPDVTPKNFQQPAWDGQPLAGKTILLYPEQGLGDTLHFARYVPMVEQAGGRVILECQPGLVEFFRENALGAGDIIPSGAPLPAFDLHAALLSLPRILGTRAGTIPGQTPYLHASPARAEAVRQRIAMYPGLKVGLSWAGNAKHASDHLRSLRLEQLRPLGDVSGVTFFNLQKGPQAGELAQSPDGLALIDLEEPHADIRHTAAIIAGLDLVITVDTLIAHLAGALGKPVWTLLPYNADWRWLLDREDTPWYPAMRLFRQPHWGAWEPVVEQVCRQLALFAQRER
jgi:tetratricopeptide (TPR) repeat protein